MLIQVNRDSKLGRQLILEMNYRHPNGTTLYEVYGRISQKKRESWERIYTECAYRSGEKLHITGAGSHMYSCIYAYPIMSEDTGEIVSMVLNKETKENTYRLELPIEEYKLLIK